MIFAASLSIGEIGIFSDSQLFQFFPCFHQFLLKQKFAAIMLDNIAMYEISMPKCMHCGTLLGPWYEK
jgi:hypothetical protein